MVITRTREICSNCGSHNIFPDDQGKAYCGSCGRRQLTHADHGRIGGLQTVLRHAPGYMKELGAKGGRPRLRQLPAPEVQLAKKEERLPSRLSELKELWRAKIKRGRAD